MKLMRIDGDRGQSKKFVRIFTLTQTFRANFLL